MINLFLFLFCIKEKLLQNAGYIFIGLAEFFIREKLFLPFLILCGLQYAEDRPPHIFRI